MTEKNNEGKRIGYDLSDIKATGKPIDVKGKRIGCPKCGSDDIQPIIDYDDKGEYFRCTNCDFRFNENGEEAK
jgi:DNA-directed RNA polymerase subunit RPC12/RpoP